MIKMPKPASRWHLLKRFRNRNVLLHASLRPRAGRKLPRELRARNVSPVAEALPLGVRDIGFEQLIGCIDTGPIHHSNQIQLFFHGEDALSSVLQSIEGATGEILLETYILRDDATGRKLLAWLVRAAARGVKVRVLADAYGSWTTKTSFWREMQSTGIEARLFHPIWSHLRGFFFRDHRKIIVIDRNISFTGGMNVANEYGSSRHSKDVSWRDTHMRIQGPTAWEMALVFSEGWERSGGESLHLPPLAPTYASGARTLVLDSIPGRGHQETVAVLAALVGASRKRLWITNSYFAPNHMGIRLLGRAAQRGVDVRLLLQGHTDMPLVRHAGHGNFHDLLSSGVRIFEYQSAILHAKTLVADDFVSVIGSTNLDFRSFYFNAECNILILDEATGRMMTQKFEEDLDQSVEIQWETWKQRSLLHRLGDAMARCLSPLL
jgi:cardiolipin synthase